MGQELGDLATLGVGHRWPVNHGGTEDTEDHGEQHQLLVVVPCILRAFRASVVNFLVIT
jgi:hypothetical protein